MKNQSLIDRIFFYFVCMIVIAESALMCWNRVQISAIDATMIQRRSIRDKQFDDIDKTINSMVDHRYRDTDAKADFAKRDAEIVDIQKQLAALKKK